MWNHTKSIPSFEVSASITAYAAKIYVFIFIELEITAGSRLRGCYVPCKYDDSSVTDEHEKTQVYTNHPS